ncbi:cytoskeleton protein RodZ [Zobellella maritima]|uniref:cytoskeleton protein RodZ n=1 Tax=Zobellella maritima TaxID=2059725 RepID=UPI000E30222F|nr:cytoskeleton protein RodZ [Zobellella maritima]
MTTNDVEQQDEAGAPESAGPGAMLRQAREAKGWTQSEVARRLNLRLAVIESIDEDHYKAGVALTFLRGYVKAYAKVVGANEQQALAAFDSMSGIGAMSAAATPMQSFSKRTRQQASDKWLKRISWLVVLLLLGSLVFWWWQDSDFNYPERREEPVVEGQTEPEAQPLELSSSEPAAPIAAEPSARVENDATAVPAANQDESQAEAANLTEAAAAEPEQALQPGVETTPPPAEETAPEPGNPNQLVMRFVDDCWIKVTDSQGKVLAQGVKKASDTLELDGTAPFRLVLGAPQAARIEYMNKEVDLSRFRAGQVARLTVPQS